MSKYKRIIVAGPLVVESVYPAPHPRDSDIVRAGKHRLTSAAQQRMNLKYAWQRLELLIAANFKPGDLWCTLTYDDDHLPATMEESVKRVKAFTRRLRKSRGKLELRYIYNKEHLHGDGRFHHHILINATGDDYDMIRKAWGQGDVDFIKMRVDKEKNYASLARYMCKEKRDKVGQRLWTGSRNLKKPESECFRVPEDTDVAAPKQATVLEEAQERNAYGHFHYVKYLAKGALAAMPRVRTPRRRPRARS